MISTVHMYAQYFQKDQVSHGGGSAGHRHDLEYVAIWLMNGMFFGVTISAHGNVERSWRDGAVRRSMMIPGTTRP